MCLSVNVLRYFAVVSSSIQSSWWGNVYKVSAKIVVNFFKKGEIFQDVTRKVKFFVLWEPCLKSVNSCGNVDLVPVLLNHSVFFFTIESVVKDVEVTLNS